MFDLSKRRAVVTAAGQGIGRATALAFAQAGATVYASDINPDTLATLAQAHANIQVAVLDVLDDQAVAAYAAQVGTIDVLFNCAGHVHAGDALACTDDEWDFAFAINCRAAFKLNQAFLPGMVAQRWGSIIHVSSIASTVRGLPNRFVYGATKAALLGMTKSIAADYVAHNVRCNAICPGTVASPSLQQRIAAQAQASGQTPEAVHDMFVSRQPLGRLGTAQEIAAAAVFLASDEGSFTTGAFFNVDGGMVI